MQETDLALVQNFHWQPILLPNFSSRPPMSFNPYPSSVLLTLVVALLGSCVGATTQLPSPPPGAVEAEQEKQRQQARLDSLAYPILARSTSLEAGDRPSRWADRLTGSLALRRAADDVRRLAFSMIFGRCGMDC